MPPAAGPPPTLIFLHILKTAGTTLNMVLENYFDERNSYATFPTRLHPDGNLAAFLALSAAAKGRLDLLTGHMGFGLHRELPRPAVYVTLLRDPVERVISRYYHERRHARSQLHAQIKAGMNLAEYVRYYQAAADMDNLQTRMVAGNWNQRGFGPCDEAMLATAKANLDNHFGVVGVTEQFDAFYILLKRYFGWRMVLFQRHNVTRDRPAAAAFPADIIQVVREHNAFDQRLYDYAAARLAADMRAGGARFQLELARFRAANYVYNRYWRLRAYSLRAQLERARS